MVNPKETQEYQGVVSAFARLRQIVPLPMIIQLRDYRLEQFQALQTARQAGLSREEVEQAKNDGVLLGTRAQIRE